jgi:hypothetical protein
MRTPVTLKLIKKQHHDKNSSLLSQLLIDRISLPRVSRCRHGSGAASLGAGPPQAADQLAVFVRLAGAAMI